MLCYTRTLKINVSIGLCDFDSVYIGDDDYCAREREKSVMLACSRCTLYYTVARRRFLSPRYIRAFVVSFLRTDSAATGTRNAPCQFYSDGLTVCQLFRPTPFSRVPTAYYNYYYIIILCTDTNVSQTSGSLYNDLRICY